MTHPENIKIWLEQGLPNAKIEVEGDGQHFSALIISADFVNKSLLQRQRMVYSVLGDKMRSEIHALSLQTLTPEEAEERK